VYEVDLLPVENEDQDSGKSGDAIAMRFSRNGGGRDAVVIIDGGFEPTGADLVRHVVKYYDTERVDLVISTHPDQDHLNGLITAIEELDVGELLIHLPRRHAPSIRGFTNLEALDELVATAQRRGTAVTQPFTGLNRMGGQVRVLGPTKDYYRELLMKQLGGRNRADLKKVAESALIRRGFRDSLAKALPFMPPETLTDDGDTTERNDSSAIVLVTVGTQRLLFTGDAGILALEGAAEEYERVVGNFARFPLTAFQAPHHGSRHNVGPSILNRLLGRPSAPFSKRCAGLISSAKAAPKHPSPKVVNALTRRGCAVAATEGCCLSLSDGVSKGRGWASIEPLPALVEEGDE
jgi:beta-lactamase superfamily II metal-dependent hydrolase